MATTFSRLLIVALIVGIVAVPLLYKVEQERRYRNLHIVAEGQLVRSGQLNPAGFERVLKELRIGTVVSFRETKDEGQKYEDQFEEDLCRSAGVKYHRFSYLDWGAADGSMPARANIDKFLALMDDPAVKKPVLIHCFAGIHRTGVHVASYRVERQGWQPADAWQELQDMGSRRTTYKDDLIRFVFALRPSVGGANAKR